MKKWLIGVCVLLLAGCGGGGLSPDDLRSYIDNPTGIVNEDNAPEIVKSALVFYGASGFLGGVFFEGPMLSPQQTYQWCDETGLCCSLSSDGKRASCRCPDGGGLSVKLGDCRRVSKPERATAFSADFSLNSCEANECVGDGSGFVEVGISPSYSCSMFEGLQYDVGDVMVYIMAGFEGEVRCYNKTYSGSYGLYIDFTSYPAMSLWVMVEYDGAIYWVDITEWDPYGTWTVWVRGKNGTVTCEMNGNSVVSCSM